MIIKFNADVVRTTASVVGVRWGLWASGAMRYCGAAPPPREVRPRNWGPLSAPREIYQELKILKKFNVAKFL